MSLSRPGLHAPVHLGLIGYPLGHSLSPPIHHAALRALEMEGDYRLFPVPPLPEGMPGLWDLLAKVRGGELQGLNVTIPHKRSVLSLLDELTPTSRAIQAVNTIYLEEGRLMGDNTDAPGFLADLRAQFPSLGEGDQRLALILGAGGSARGVSYALIQAGWQVCLAARRLEQAQELAASFLESAEDRFSVAVRLDSNSIHWLQSRFSIDLVVNCTPLGMMPDVEASPWPEGIPFPERAFVYDLVYNPPETSLMRAASAAGLPVANGLGMLVEQAALSFECWTGLSAPRKAMREAVAST